MASALYLTPGCFDKGGISRYSRYQIRAMRELLGDDQVSALSLLGPDGDSFEEPIDVQYAAGGAEVVQKSAFLLQSAMFARRVHPRLIVAAHVNLSMVGLCLARVTGARLVVNIYGSEVWSGLRRDSRFGLARADVIVSDCHFTAEYCEAAGVIRAGVVRVIWDCVDLNKFNPGQCRQDVLVRYGIPDPNHHKLVLSLGRMSTAAAHKGYGRLLQVFARIAPSHPSARLVFAGRGDLIPVLRGCAASLGVSDRVFFLGAVDERDLPDVYRAAHVFSLVSDRGIGRGEGIPLSPLEAGACGVPLLVGDQDGSVEAVREFSNGFALDPFDLSRHAQLLAQLLDDQKLRSQLGANAAAVARQEFSYERFKRDHQCLLESLGIQCH